MLFVTGRAAHSLRAIHVVRDLVDSGRFEDCELEVIDVAEAEDRADALGVFATPTLLRVDPGPERRIVGDLGDADRVFEAMRA